MSFLTFLVFFLVREPPCIIGPLPSTSSIIRKSLPPIIIPLWFSFPAELEEVRYGSSAEVWGRACLSVPSVRSVTRSFVRLLLQPRPPLSLSKDIRRVTYNPIVWACHKQIRKYTHTTNLSLVPMHGIIPPIMEKKIKNPKKKNVQK